VGRWERGSGSEGRHVPSKVGRRGGTRSSPATLADESGTVSQVDVCVPVHRRTAKLHVPSATPSASQVGSPSVHTTPLPSFVAVPPRNPLPQSVSPTPPPPPPPP